MKTLLVISVFALIFHITLSGPGDGGPGDGGPRDGGPRDGGPGKGGPRGPRAEGMMRRGRVEGRGAENGKDGDFKMESKDRSISILLRGYTELDGSGNAIPAHSSENTTKLDNMEPMNETLPFSVADGGGAINGLCLTSTTTFEAGTLVELKGCVAKENGTITLGNDVANQDVLTVSRGFGKYSLKISGHTWCDMASCGVVGAKLRLDFEVKTGGKAAGKGPAKRARGPKQGGKRPPKIIDFGTDAQMFLSTKAAVLIGNDENAVQTWVDLAETDAEITSADGKNTASFTFAKPTPDATKTIWYDPVMSVEGDEYVDDGDDGDDNSAPNMAAALITIIASIIASVMLY